MAHLAGGVVCAVFAAMLEEEGGLVRNGLAASSVSQLNDNFSTASGGPFYKYSVHSQCVYLLLRFCMELHHTIIKTPELS